MEPPAIDEDAAWAELGDADRAKYDVEYAAEYYAHGAVDSDDEVEPAAAAMAAAAAADGGEQGSPTTSTEDDGTDSPAQMDTTCWEREGSGALL